MRGELKIKIYRSNLMVREDSTTDGMLRMFMLKEYNK